MFLLRDLPKYDCLQAMSRRHPEIDPSAVESCLVLLRVAGDVLSALDTHFARHETSHGRFTVLMLLYRERTDCEGKGTASEGMSPSELATRAGVTRATMTGLIDGLESDRMVVREPHPRDRRTVNVRLTPKAVRFLRDMLPDHFQRVAGLMAGLSDEERKTLTSLLAKVAEGVPAIRERYPEANGHALPNRKPAGGKKAKRPAPAEAAANPPPPAP